MRANRIKCILISAVFITLCVFPGCVYYNGSPRHGHWETSDQSIVIWYENFDASYITLDGTRINCIIGNEHGSDDVWFEAAFDIPDLCKKGEILAEGKTIRLDDNEWVIRIDGIEYHLHQS